MRAAVVLAYHPTNESRAVAFRLVSQFWQEAPIPFVLAGRGQGARPGLYNVGHAKNEGVGLLDPAVDTLVLADADTIPRSYAQIAEAAWGAFTNDGLVYCADAIRCLTQTETETARHWREVCGAKGDGGRETDSMSGLIAIRRDCFAQVGGFDPAYVGYGFEDLDFRRRCASNWPVRSVRGEALHFWHEPDPDKDPGSEIFQANEKRWRGGLGVAA